jgi:hypothetical protein
MTVSSEADLRRRQIAVVEFKFLDVFPPVKAVMCAGAVFGSGNCGGRGILPRAAIR